MLIQLSIFSLYLISIGIILYICYLIITADKQERTPLSQTPFANTPKITRTGGMPGSGRGEL